MTASSSSVRVAVRVRPLTEQEKQRSQHNVISFNQQQIILNGDRPFTFDYVYPPTVTQEEVYNTSVIPLLNKFIEGYNSTILAYGQTGSGKTYSMGIGMNSSIDEGIVPRFIHSLFKNLDVKKLELSNYSYQVYVSFLELHNEDLVDLLSPIKKKELNLTIREDSHGNICWAGVREEPVNHPIELLDMLQKGSIARTTASTDMNSTSSRSHAIFSVILKQYITDSDLDGSEKLITKKLVSKFHFVDLAGSERLKRTNAVGDRAKEGISINSGLLALGNVISALGDESRRVSHIPYRDSKLTRLLQDSLGGNSQTLMIACASPAEYNIPETLNTLKYANRARNIRNRVVVNQEINESEKLKMIISKLKEELKSTNDFLYAVNDEMDKLKIEANSLGRTLDETVKELASVKYERDQCRLLLHHDDSLLVEPNPNHELLKEYAMTIEMLRAELNQSQHILSNQTQRDRMVLSVDRVDSSHTLVDHYPSSGDDKHSDTTLCDSDYSNRLVSDRKKKIHRVSSKRSKIVLRQKSLTTSSPKPIKALDLFSKKDEVLHHAIKKIEKETEFLESAKISMLNSNLPEEKMNIWNDTKPIQYRKSTMDHTIPVAGVLQTDQLKENKKLLQKLTKAIEAKHLMVRQLERSEKLRMEQVNQLNRKMADLASKKTNILTQYKRELNDLRHQSECRIKKLQSDQQLLRRKHMQLMSKSDQSRNQQQSVIEQLNRTIDKLGHEKKKLIKRLKLEADRAKERHLESERDLTKSKRQEAQLVSTKKRLEREILQHKLSYKRSTEEIVALHGQMKQITVILKKLISTKKSNLDLMDKSLLSKAIACANVRGYLVKQNSIKKTGGKFKVSSLQQHVYQKKRLIHRAISLYVKGQSNTKISEELIQKRDRLLEEQKELLSERQLVINEENKYSLINKDNDPQYMDERIDLITLQLDNLNQQIAGLNEITNNLDDDENWMDIVDKELFMSDNTDSAVAYEAALSLIRSLEPDEARLVSESLMEDLITLKTKHQTNIIMTQNLNHTVFSLQTALVQMRRTEPKKINTNFLSPLDSVFIKVLQSPVNIKCGLVLPQ